MLKISFWSAFEVVATVHAELEASYASGRRYGHVANFLLELADD